MHAVLQALHLEKCILTKEECRSVEEAGSWWDDELALTVAVKPSGVVKQTLDVMQEYKEELWYSRLANCINGV